MPIAAFSAPILGLLTQSSAFGTLSQNISNVNTGGYKETNTRFNTIVANKLYNNNDIGGVTAVRKQYVDTQGTIISTTNNLDVAISGHGMFVVNTESDGSGDTRYTRDGGFQIKVDGTDTVTNSDGSVSTVNKGYLADKNGNFVMGWEPEADGTFNTSGTPVPIRLDENAFTSQAAATDSASIAINLPANAAPGTEQETTQSVFDSTGALHSFALVWTKGATPQEWTVRVRSDDAGESDPDSSVLGATTTPSLTTSPITLNFGTDGHLPDPTTESLSIAFSDGTTIPLDLDITDVTSLSDHFINFNFQKDGRPPGVLKSYRFDGSGTIQGLFTNGLEEPLYKMPIATFTNADGLTPLQGNEYTESVTSGSATLRQVKDPSITVNGANGQKNEYAEFVPFSHELSNVNLSSEFTLMIMTQQAYNSNATVFKTVDEMTKVAEELKS
jgi:flagellar hook protein FlgE